MAQKLEMVRDLAVLLPQCLLRCWSSHGIYFGKNTKSCCKQNFDNEVFPEDCTASPVTGAVTVFLKFSSNEPVLPPLPAIIFCNSCKFMNLSAVFIKVVT